MDFELNDLEKILQSAAWDFARKEVQPLAAEVDRSGEFPLALVKRMGELGYLGLPYPRSYGGAGAGYIGYTLVIEQVCRCSATVGAIIAVSSLFQESLFRFGNETQKLRYLVPAASGNSLACFAFTEPDTGSDPKAITTVARQSNSGYLVTGQKNFISLSPVAQFSLVFARDETGLVSAFIIDASDSRFVIQEACQTIGLRGLGTSMIYLDSIPVNGDDLLGEKGRGYEILLEAISLERVGVSAESVGIAQAALDLSVDYARQRIAYGKSIAKMPTIQWLLAEMDSRLEAARWLTYRVAWLRDRGLDIRKESSEAKLFASQAAVDVTRMAMQVHGAYGTMKSLPVERLYRDAKMVEVYVGVSEIQRVIIASSLM